MAAKQGGFLATAEQQVWRVNNRGFAEPEPAWLAPLEQQAALGDAPPYTLEKLVMDLHTGKFFFGKTGAATGPEPLMAGLAVALLLLVLPSVFGLWHVLGGLGHSWQRSKAERPSRGLRLFVLWRDDPTPELFRLWLVGWPLLLPPFKAGQHCVLSLRDTAGETQRRAYSLAGWRRWPFAYCLAIRKGAQVSKALHENAKIGSWLQLSVPKGAFCGPCPRRAFGADRRRDRDHAVSGFGARARGRKGSCCGTRNSLTGHGKTLGLAIAPAPRRPPPR